MQGIRMYENQISLISSRLFNTHCFHFEELALKKVCFYISYLLHFALVLFSVYSAFWGGPENVLALYHVQLTDSSCHTPMHSHCLICDLCASPVMLSIICKCHTPRHDL